MRIEDAKVGQRVTTFGHNYIYFVIVGRDRNGDVIVEGFYRSNDQFVELRSFHKSVNVDLYVVRVSTFRNIYTMTMGRGYASREECLTHADKDVLGVLEVIRENGVVVDSQYHKK